MRYVIGLTGGIACGKSAVSNIFEKQGIPIIDTDIISKQLMQKGGKCYEEVVSFFPDCVVDGTLSRSLLKNAVFSDKQKLAMLNDITHKHIRQATENEIAKNSGVMVVVVPLMFESGFDKFCDCIIDVACSEDVRINRLINRDNISKELAESIIKSQLSDKERREKSDYIIENDTTVKELNEKALSVIKIILEKQK